jgi:predicted solute-binding protein
MDEQVTRKYTNKLIESIEEGWIAPQEVVQMALNYMSEHDVEDMLRCNDIDLFPEENEDEG